MTARQMPIRISNLGWVKVSDLIKEIEGLSIEKLMRMKATNSFRSISIGIKEQWPTISANSKTSKTIFIRALYGQAISDVVADDVRAPLRKFIYSVAPTDYAIQVPLNQWRKIETNGIKCRHTYEPGCAFLLKKFKAVELTGATQKC